MPSRLERVASVVRSAGGPMSTVSAALFAGLSGVRRKRVFHPMGDAYGGRVAIAENAWGLPFEGEHEVVVRMSRGAGVPEPLPDLYGIAIKFVDMQQDLLLVTSGRGAVTRHTLLPAMGALRLPFSSVLPYELNDELVVFGAEAADDIRSADEQQLDDLSAFVATGRLRFDLTIARVGSERPERFGLLVVDSKHEGDVSFNPWNTHPALRPAGALNKLRRESYESSQAARPTARAEV